MWGGLGATRWRWTRPVRKTVQRTLSRFGQARANTYIGHPWPGWMRVSVDYWGTGGRGDPLPAALAPTLAQFLLSMPGEPHIRHLIYEHNLWTSWGGWTTWRPDDHSGELRHVHVTYWK